MNGAELQQGNRNNKIEKYRNEITVTEVKKLTKWPKWGNGGD